MTHSASAVNSANAFWKLPDRIDFDGNNRAEQFAAFLQARVSENAMVPRAANPFRIMMEVSQPQGPRVSSFPPRGRAHGISGELPSQTADSNAAKLQEETQPSSAQEMVEPQSAVRPFTPRYKGIPDSWKWPIGPYQQAPPEFGGDWWLVNPFTGAEPWRPVALEQSGGTELPKGFLEVFGSPPRAADFATNTAFRAARARWQQDREHFRQTGIPEGFDQAQVDLAAGVFEHWGLGRPVFYEGRYGWVARFPDSSIAAFEANPATVIELPHLIVAKFQTRQLVDGVTPPIIHPFVPPILTKADA